MPAFIQNMGVNHGRSHIPVPQELLHGPDVVAIFEQVGCKRMPERVAAAVPDEQSEQQVPGLGMRL
jgi:hypothetical protein